MVVQSMPANNVPSLQKKNDGQLTPAPTLVVETALFLKVLRKKSK